MTRESSNSESGEGDHITGILLNTGQCVLLDRKVLTVGRDGGCEIRFADEPGVQPQHAQIRQIGGRWLIESGGDWPLQAGSSQPGKTCWLNPGDIIQLGPDAPSMVFMPTTEQVSKAIDNERRRNPATAVVEPPLPPQATIIRPVLAEPPPPPSGRIAEPPPPPSRSPPSPPPPSNGNPSVEWHYILDEQQHGPVSLTQLQQLVVCGRLQGSDMVWKEGMAEWLTASGVNALFPKPASATPPPPPGIGVPPPPTQAGPPPIASSPPATGKTYLKSWSKTAGEMAARIKAAGLLTAKQAQRTKIASITLPSAYRSLGRQIYSRGDFRDEFGVNYKQLDDLTAGIKNISDQSAARPKAEGFQGKAKAAAVATKEMAQTKGLEIRLAQALGALGDAAYQKHGEQSGPVELIAPISKAKSQIQHLDEEIARLSESKPGQILTPKRIAVGGIAAILLIGVFLIVSQSSSKAPAFSASGNSGSSETAAPGIGTSSDSGGGLGGSVFNKTPYAGTDKQIQTNWVDGEAALIKRLQVKDWEAVPDDEKMTFIKKCETDANGLLAAVPPPVVDISPSARQRISDVKTAPMTMVIFMGRNFQAHFTFVTQSPLKKYQNDHDLKLRAIDASGAVVHEEDISIDADVDSGERASGWGYVGDLEKLHHLEIVGPNLKAKFEAQVLGDWKGVGPDQRYNGLTVTIQKDNVVLSGEGDKTLVFPCQLDGVNQTVTFKRDNVTVSASIADDHRLYFRRPDRTDVQCFAREFKKGGIFLRPSNGEIDLGN